MTTAENFNVQRDFVPRHTDSPQMSASGQNKQLFNPDISKINEDESFNVGDGNFDTSLMNSEKIKRRESLLNRSTITDK